VSPTSSHQGKPILTLAGDTKTVRLSLAELKAMPKYTGWAGIKTSVGTLIAPAKYAGVRLTDLAELVGGISKDNGVTILAKDGYGMTLSYDQVSNEGFTTFDPATGEEEPPSEPLTVILAYERSGKLLDPYEEGPLRLEVAQPEPAQLVDGHWTVKWVDRVEVKAATADWTVKLKGAVDSQITRVSYTSCSSPGCHGGVWADKDGTLWQGIPLWLAVGMVDDQQKHDKGAFNRKLARAGETVEVRAADGTTTTLAAVKVFNDREILLAAKMSGEELPEEYFPVRLVGPGLTDKQMVGQVVKVVVLPPR
jgi:DMSO/TMAO reductase YedYZ molybdopterin-dependent catalytic subunit